MSLEPKIGLVTVLYNGKEVLEGFFRSLKIQTYKNFKLYVIDNSPDNEALVLAQRLSAQFSLQVEFINNNANLGVATGNNQGIKAALKDKCEFVLLLNNDIEFDDRVIEHLIETAQTNNERILVPKIYYYGSDILWMAGGKFKYQVVSTPHRGELERDEGQYDNDEYIEYAPTCFMLIHKEVFDNVGIMDETFFVYYDDSDFVYRCNQLGYSICYKPSEKVYHKVSFSTGGAESSFSIYYGMRNRIYFVKKHYRALQRYISLALITGIFLIKYIKYDGMERSKLVEGFRHGFKL